MPDPILKLAKYILKGGFFILFRLYRVGAIVVGRPILNQSKMKVLISFLIILFASCQSEEIALTRCGFIEATRSGSTVSIIIHSTEPTVTMCRDLGRRESCLTIDSAYYGCIRIESNRGECLRFDTETQICQIIIE